MLVTKPRSADTNVDTAACRIDMAWLQSSRQRGLAWRPGLWRLGLRRPLPWWRLELLRLRLIRLLELLHRLLQLLRTYNLREHSEHDKQQCAQQTGQRS
jgi:hypothetical protein